MSIYEYNYRDGINHATYQFFKEGDGRILRNDNRAVVWLKCVGLLALIPVATIGRVFSHVIVGLYAATCMSESKLKGRARKVVVKEYFLNAAKALYFGVKMEGAALAGLVNPYYGRRKYGEFEATLNGHPLETEKGLGERLKEKFYLAPCFQGITRLSASDRNERLKSYVDYEKGLKGRVSPMNGRDESSLAGPLVVVCALLAFVICFLLYVCCKREETGLLSLPQQIK